MTLLTVDRSLDDTIDGAVNFRDLGGYPAAGGRVRSGLIYRSGLTHAISARGLRTIARTLGVRLVIDLRTRDEVATACAPWSTVGVSHALVSLSSQESISREALAKMLPAMYRGEFDWAGHYIEMARGRGSEIARVFALLGASDGLPALFHCAGGRDRTGVTAALLLSLLGVEDSVIAEDYALTGALLRRHRHHFHDTGLTAGLDADQMLKAIETTPDPMFRFLSWVAEEHGSAEHYLTSHGLDHRTVTSLRQQLLV